MTTTAKKIPAKTKGGAKKIPATTFNAECHNLRLVRHPSMDVEERFRRHVTEDQLVPPQSVEFEDHRFTTEDPDLVEWLEGHNLFNVKFWEMGKAPNEAKPTIKTQTDAIMEAMGARDAEALRTLLDEERKNHDRAVVVNAAEAALRNLSPSDTEDESGIPGPPG